VDLRKTPVERIDAYYVGRKDGIVELHNMHAIDYNQAAEAHPKDWVLEEPAGKRVVDKREAALVFPQPPPSHAPGPPMAPMDPDRIRNIVHAGAQGGRVRRS